MSDAPDPADISRWQRFFAIECNNRAWDLASQAQRSAEENDEMLFAAYAAAYHWKFAGDSLNHARADLTLAHVHALLKHGRLALEYAQRCLEYFKAHPAADWDLAFAHLEIAHAAAAANYTPLHQEYYAQAVALGQAIAEEQDRQIFLTELANIPQPPPLETV